MDIFKEYAKLVGDQLVNELKNQGYVIGQIKKARHEKKISQQQLANAIGVSKSTIARIESGVCSPNSQTLQRISDALDTPIVIAPSRFTTELEATR